MNISAIEKKLGYIFQDKTLCIDALTHPSARLDTRFELLEFLGDRVLALCTANILQTKNETIKQIARKHASLVSTACIKKVAEEWNMKKILQHEIQKLSDKVLADAVEAILGAVFADAGYEAAHNIIERFWQKFMGTDAIEPKMQLQELAQSKKLGIPKYELITTSGADHDKSYKVSVVVDNLGSGIGIGKSKHEASKNAAINLLSKLV